MVELRFGRSVAAGERSPSPVGARVNTPEDRAPVRFVFGDIRKYFPSKVKLYFFMEFFSPMNRFCHYWGHFLTSVEGMGCVETYHGIRANGFHGLNNDENVIFTSYSVFRSFHGLAVILKLLQQIITTVHV